MSDDHSEVHDGVRNLRNKDPGWHIVALSACTESCEHSKNAYIVVDEHGLVEEAIVTHGDEVVEEITCWVLDEEHLKGSVLLPAFAVQEIKVVASKDHADQAVKEWDDSIPEIKMVFSAEVFVRERQRHDNIVEDVPGSKGYEKTSEYFWRREVGGEWR